MYLICRFKFVEISNLFYINAVFMVWAHVGIQYDINHCKYRHTELVKGDGIAERNLGQKHINQLWRYMYLHKFWVLIMIDELRWWITLEWISLRLVTIYIVCPELLIDIMLLVAFHIKSGLGRTHMQETEGQKKVACNLLLILLRSNVTISTYGAANSYLIQTTFQ